MRVFKALRIPVKILLFTAIAVTILVLLGNALYPADSVKNIMDAYFYEQETAPELLVLGNSLSYNSFVPLYYTELTGETVNDLSTPAQSFMLSYYYLKEAVERGKAPKTVLLQATHSRFIYPMTNQHTASAVHAMPMGLNKLALVTKLLPEDIPDMLNKAFHARDQLPGKLRKSTRQLKRSVSTFLSDIKRRVLGRLTAGTPDPEELSADEESGFPAGEVPEEELEREESEASDAWEDESEENDGAEDESRMSPGEEGDTAKEAGEGNPDGAQAGEPDEVSGTSEAADPDPNRQFMPEDYTRYLNLEYRAYNAHADEAIDNHSVLLKSPAVFEREAILPEAEYWFGKIADYCREKGIELIAYSIPCLPAYMIYGNFEEFHDYAMEITEKYGVEFWDLGYIRPEWVVTEPDMFIDYKHGNYRLAFPLTNALAEIRTARKNGETDLSEYLFDSFDGFLEAHQGVNGVRLKKITRDGSKFVQVDIIATPGAVWEWRTLVKQGGKWVTYQDWNDSDALALEKKHKKKLMRFEVRDPETLEILQTVEGEF